MAENNNLVFVYGINDSIYLGKGRTVSSDFVMRAVSYPFVSDVTTNTAQYSTRIFGELYQVTDKVLKDLDRLEGHPDFYQRRLVLVDFEDNGTEVAWMYINNKPSGAIIESGNYEDFKSPGEI
jgi:gamma-glutamylcyclotransferase (GGCT)/AIG2-like uncharacterized protein YtfP